ncbi:hypothetical protein GN956_G24237 [Arapaima gigas]
MLLQSYAVITGFIIRGLDKYISSLLDAELDSVYRCSYNTVHFSLFRHFNSNMLIAFGLTLAFLRSCQMLDFNYIYIPFEQGVCIIFIAIK